MIRAATLPRRLLVIGASVALALSLAAPVATVASSHDAELMATLELPQGDVDFDLELGTLHFFDEENAPFAIQIVDGCAINGHLWAFGAGLSAVAANLTIIDDRSGESRRLVLPAYEPGNPIGTVIDTEALEICRTTQAGGLPAISGTATYTSATARCPDFSEGVELLSEGRDDAYRTFLRSGNDASRIIRDGPIVAVDETDAWDELHLMVEGRTPRLVEGAVFSGDQGMLPRSSALGKSLKGITKARVRRAFETAKSGRVPQGIIDDLGLKGVDCVYHVSLDLDSLAADAYLAEAGWIKDGGAPLELPQPVADRFIVDIVRADGETRRLPLTGPLVGSDAEGSTWEYEVPGVKVQIFDGCALSGSFWTIAAAVIEEPVQLVVTDSESGATAEHLLWTDRAEVSWLADTAGLAGCGT